VGLRGLVMGFGRGFPVMSAGWVGSEVTVDGEVAAGGEGRVGGGRWCEMKFAVGRCGGGWRRGWRSGVGEGVMVCCVEVGPGNVIKAEGRGVEGEAGVWAAKSR